MTLPSLRIEGAILSPDILSRLDTLKGQRDADFVLGDNVRVKDEVLATWAEAQALWKTFRRKTASLPEGATGTSETRDYWLIPLLRLLGYAPELRGAGVRVGERNYRLSHRCTRRTDFILHLVGSRVDLDKRDHGGLGRQISHHALVQEFLNLTEHDYAIVSNGLELRLLRDSTRLVKLSFVAFDLQRIFDENLYADFAVLFRLLHASRMPAEPGKTAESLIEFYHQDSVESGSRIRDALSGAVEHAITDLANGLLDFRSTDGRCPNDTLCAKLLTGNLAPHDFYRQLLRLVYRLLFLMVAEERDLLHAPVPPADDPARETNLRQRRYYRDFYSLERLRRLAEVAHLADARHRDLWESLKSLFRLVAPGDHGRPLGLAPLGGLLFGPDATPDLDVLRLDNKTLLAVLQRLSVFVDTKSKQTIRINYAALNTEEFGSVYETLLEYEPAIPNTGEKLTFTLARGGERAATGSHYTPEDLVQPLLKHSLDHLIAEKLSQPDPEKALLSLRICDPTCGSGHILLSAARRVATELAVLRTGEDQPSPLAFREALRDVIHECVYGVDLNPLAVELCKVALWLEAQTPGKPLNFLDHHIKCGNAIVGFATRDELERGVPDEAFEATPEDDKSVASAFRKRNKTERAQETRQGQLALDPAVNRQLDAILARWREISGLPEHSPAEIAAKKECFDTFAQSQDAWILNQVAAIPIAQFYLPKTADNRAKLITDSEYRAFLAGRTPQGQATAAAWDIALRKRFFHWFLEFPDVLSSGGFDCILGNPPYLGGTKLSGTYGHAFCQYVRWEFAPTGLSDLVCFFVRRFHSLLRSDGFFAFITTNSIKDGDIRRDGLEAVVECGDSINFATRAIKWPGKAKIIVSLLSIKKGEWRLPCLLDERSVSSISPFLDDSAGAAPVVLSENENLLFEGTKWLGDGFVVTRGVAQEFIADSPRNEEVVFSLINGKELNNVPNQAPQRKIIDFGDCPEAVAKSYELPYRHILELVKPVRDADNRSVRRIYWWRHAERAKGLYANLKAIKRCFAIGRSCKHLSFSAFPVDCIFSEALKVLTVDRWDLFSILQSSLHEAWARRYSGEIKQDLRYTPSDCFETYPFPEGLWRTESAELASLGERYHEHRRHLMLRLWLGLTDTYNLFHSPDLDSELQELFTKRAAKPAWIDEVPEEHRAAALACTLDEARAGILTLRDLHRALDLANLAAYGWHQPGPDGPAIDLGHAFRDIETLPENDRTRFTISPAARKELLRRLLTLNHARAAQESAAGVAPAKPEKGSRKPGKSKASQLVDDLLANLDSPGPTASNRIKLSEDDYARTALHHLFQLKPEGIATDDLIRLIRLLSETPLRAAVATPAEQSRLAVWPTVPVSTLAALISVFLERGNLALTRGTLRAGTVPLGLDDLNVEADTRLALDLLSRLPATAAEAPSIASLRATLINLAA